jgi:uncharacterized protein YecE (DUF72 family)
MSVYIGTSGWSYDHWQGLLYPYPTPVGKRLPYYLARYNTVEVNSTYYRWPADSVFAGWKTQLPAGFVMTVKAARGLTHYTRLYAPEKWTARIAQGMRQLGEHRGVLLIQLPPQFTIDYERLEWFLRQLPDDLKVAVEFRHGSWHTEAIFALLERYGAAYCVMSGAHLPCILRATAPFVYVRFHGPDWNHLYAGSYSDDDMRWWADRFGEWQAQGRDVYAYFNNDGDGNALRNADTLKYFAFNSTQ